MNNKIQKLIYQIAQKCLGIKTLQKCNKDSLDFHDVAVWNIEQAQMEAYKAGFNDGAIHAHNIVETMKEGL